MRRVRPGSIALVLVGALGACDDDGSSPVGGPGTGPVQRLELEGTSGTLAVGDTAVVRVGVGGRPLAASVTWTSSDTLRATVSPAGVVTARRPGPVTIRATTAPASVGAPVPTGSVDLTITRVDLAGMWRTDAGERVLPLVLALAEQAGDSLRGYGGVLAERASDASGEIDVRVRGSRTAAAAGADSVRLSVPFSPSGPCRFGTLTLAGRAENSTTLRLRVTSRECREEFAGRVLTLRRVADTLTTAARPAMAGLLGGEFRIAPPAAQPTRGPIVLAFEDPLGALVHARVTTPAHAPGAADTVAATLGADGALAFRTHWFVSPRLSRVFTFRGAIRGDTLVGSYVWFEASRTPPVDSGAVRVVRTRAPLTPDLRRGVTGPATVVRRE
jgi:hypothetical protein